MSGLRVACAGFKSFDQTLTVHLYKEVHETVGNHIGK